MAVVPPPLYARAAAGLKIAEVNPAMAALKPLAAESLAAAQRTIDDLWSLNLAASASR